MVFVNEHERLRRDPGARGAVPVPAHGVDVAATPIDVPKRAPIQQPRPRIASPSASSLGCIGGLIRLAVFAIVVWYVGKWLLAIPEVRTLISALRSGVFSDDQVTAAIDAVRTHIFQLVGVSPGSPGR
jgi:hypothetical protein